MNGMLRSINLFLTEYCRKHWISFRFGDTQEEINALFASYGKDAPKYIYASDDFQFAPDTDAMITVSDFSWGGRAFSLFERGKINEMRIDGTWFSVSSFPGGFTPAVDFHGGNVGTVNEITILPETYQQLSDHASMKIGTVTVNPDSFSDSTRFYVLDGNRSSGEYAIREINLSSDPWREDLIPDHADDGSLYVTDRIYLCVSSYGDRCVCNAMAVYVNYEGKEDIHHSLMKAYTSLYSEDETDKANEERMEIYREIREALESGTGVDRSTLRFILNSGKITDNELRALYEELQLSYEALRYQTRRACAEAKVEYRGEHVFRHTFATNCYYKGVDVKILSRLLGHADTKLLSR